MTDHSSELSKAFHATRRADTDATVRELAGSKPSEGYETLENRLDRADSIFATLYHAGLEADTEPPSVRRARLQREAMAENRPPCIQKWSWSDREYGVKEKEIQAAEDPKVALASESSGTIAIQEVTNDNDPFAGSRTVEWLRCDDIEDAERYLEQVGLSFEEPGAGEGDGRYISRTVYLKQSDTGYANMTRADGHY
jgi:hypothetical protein